jgi:hypothetical protein
MVLKRKWSTSHINVDDVPLLEPPTEVENIQDLFPHSEEIEASLPQIYKDDLFEEAPLVDRSFSTEVNSFHEESMIINVEDSRVLLGVFKHQHLYSCKRDLRAPARVIM